MIENIKKHTIVVATSDGHSTKSKPDTVYYPTPELVEYFSHSASIHFLNIEFYRGLCLPSEDKLDSFFKAIGISDAPRVTTIILSNQFNNASEYAAPNVSFEWATREIRCEIPHIDGMDVIISAISSGFSRSISLKLWEALKSVCIGFGLDSEYAYGGLAERLLGIRRYFYRTEKTQRFETKQVYQLRRLPWLLNSEGVFVSPADIIESKLDKEYDVHSRAGQKVIEFLQIKQEEDAGEELLSERQKNQIAIGELFADCSAEEIEKLLALKNEMKSGAKSISEDRLKLSREANQEATSGDNVQSGNTEEVDDNTNDIRNRVLRKLNRMRSSEDNLSSSESIPIEEGPENDDEDDYTRPSVDYQKLIDQRLKKSNAEIDAIALAQQYDDEANRYPRYTYGWFKALLNLEILSNNQNATAKKVFTISFGRVERELGTERTLVLGQPDRYIPQNMEDLADISLVLRGEGFERSVAIEVVNVHSYTLRAKLKNVDQLNAIDLSAVKQATISVQNPVFLLEELKKGLTSLELDDYTNMRDNLCENIRFVFGPPGTGKTTYLASDVILPLMRRTENAKILVLTPTNKAADVLTARIMGKASEAECDEWLIRFGATGDELVEKSGVYRDKGTDILSFSKCTVITTMARFPYDFFMPENKRVFINGINWDYIIIDEASMIPLVDIIYPLYKKTPTEFIVAGDPFQIEPITNVDKWKDENIYTLVGLQAFKENPSTVPHLYPVKLLMTQYRSIPAVGNVFSKFAYNGALLHYRSADNAKDLHLKKYLEIKPLNILKFPVSKYESIYRVKRLQGKTSYQVYSALFTFEFTRFLSERLAHTNPGKPFSIGIIAPYRGEADLIEKLVGTIKRPHEISIHVGTIHGFQGDECDIVMTVFNPPPKITESPTMFLNKRNIINVAISRARDYLFVIMPDDQTENIQNLRLVRKVEKLCKEEPELCHEYTSAELEQIMFGQTDYLEQNSFSTGHQSVNVYGLPERKYEVRSEENAVDIQIHKAMMSSAGVLQTSNVVTDHTVQSATDNNQSQSEIGSANLPIVYVLSNDALCCPVDKEKLVSTYLEVQRNDGKKRRLGIHRCTQCNQSYIFQSELTATINKLAIALHSAEELLVDIERVFSKTDGDGVILEHYIRHGSRYIRVRFDNDIKEFPEDQAFSTGLLRLLK